MLPGLFLQSPPLYLGYSSWASDIGHLGKGILNCCFMIVELTKEFYNSLKLAKGLRDWPCRPNFQMNQSQEYRADHLSRQYLQSCFNYIICEWAQIGLFVIDSCRQAIIYSSCLWNPALREIPSPYLHTHSWTWQGLICHISLTLRCHWLWDAHCFMDY